MPTGLSISFLLVALARFASAQEPAVPWFSDFKSAHAAAAERGTPLLVVFTLGSGCSTCGALEKKVFATDDYAASAAGKWVHLRLSYSGKDGSDRAAQVLAASARLKGFPTLVLLDKDGWPFFASEGYDGEAAAAIASKLGAALADKDLPAARRKAGPEGYAELLAWYRARGIRLGETMAAAALVEHSNPAERAAFAPLLVAAAVAREGEAGAAPHLAAAFAEDADGTKGIYPDTLRAAGSQFLRVPAFKDAARCFEKLTALAGTPNDARLEATMSLGYAYRKLEAPCLAREHYARALALAEAGGGGPKSIANHARAQLERIEACPKGRCACAERRVAGH